MPEPDAAVRQAPAPVGETFRRSLAVRVTTEGRRSTFQIMTGGLARDGMVVEPSGGDVASFLLNPVVLWQHGFDFQRGNLPIGRAPSVGQTDGGWAAEVEWASDEFAQTVAGMVRDGFLNAVSLGWRTLDAGWETRDGREVYVVRRWELMEFSVVAVPADADALVMQRADAALAAEVARLRAEVAQLRAAAPEVPAVPDATPSPEPAPDTPAPDAPGAPAEPARTLTDEQIEGLAEARVAALLARADHAFNCALGRA